MNFAWSTLIGFCMGFGFGVGCALAVLYTIYLGGYSKAIEHSLADPHPPPFLRRLAAVEAKRAKQLSQSKIPAPPQL